jgi:hypothetical protein
MVDVEWIILSEEDQRERLWHFVAQKATPRKARLLACACCRTAWDVLPIGPLRSAVDVAERDVEGLATDAEVEIAFENAHHAAYPTHGQELPRDLCIIPDAHLAALETGRNNHPAFSAMIALKAVTKSRAVSLLSDIFGNPFRPLSFTPDWRTPTVSSLAQAIYGERAFDRLPILADALEDAGCDNADILNHCRQPGEHVRGCWVVDLILGKE